MSLFRNIGFFSLRNSLLMEIMISSLFILSSGNVESTIWINSFNFVPCWIVNPFSSKCILSWRIKRVTFYLSHFHGRMQRISRLSESLATPQLLSKEWISLLYIFFMFLNLYTRARSGFDATENNAKLIYIYRFPDNSILSFNHHKLL